MKPLDLCCFCFNLLAAADHLYPPEKHALSSVHCREPFAFVRPVITDMLLSDVTHKSALEAASSCHVISNVCFIIHFNVMCYTVPVLRLSYLPWMPAGSLAAQIMGFRAEHSAIGLKAALNIKWETLQTWRRQLTLSQQYILKKLKKKGIKWFPSSFEHLASTHSVLSEGGLKSC